MMAYLCLAKRRLSQDDEDSNRTIICNTVSRPEVTREPVVAGSLPPGMTGYRQSWVCPNCRHRHVDGRAFVLVEVMIAGIV
jgi:hypothetical protein